MHYHHIYVVGELFAEQGLSFGNSDFLHAKAAPFFKCHITTISDKSVGTLSPLYGFID